MEELKEFSELLDADGRWEFFARRNVTTNEVSRFTLNDRYNSVAEITLSTASPENVQSQFNIARMLCIYAWLHYPLHQVAELKAFSTVEMALRLRFPQAKGTLNKLLSFSVEAGVIVDKGFSHIDVVDEDATWYSRELPMLVSSMRNELAHGRSILHPGSLFTLRNSAEIINQLFPEVK